jgi:hypothetical protein
MMGFTKNLTDIVFFEASGRLRMLDLAQTPANKFSIRFKNSLVFKLTQVKE